MSFRDTVVTHLGEIPPGRGDSRKRIITYSVIGPLDGNKSISLQDGKLKARNDTSEESNHPKILHSTVAFDQKFLSYIAYAVQRSSSETQQVA